MNLALLMDEALQDFGEYDRLVFEGRVWKSSELHRLSCGLAGGLKGLGVKTGEVIHTLLPNGPEAVLCQAGVWRMGGVLAPLFPQLTAPEIAARATHCRAVAIITTAKLFPKVAGAVKSAPLRCVIVVGGEDQPQTGHHSFEQLVADSSPEIAARERREDDLALILYTGGTTGRPKGVMITHQSLRASVANDIARPKRMVTLHALPLAHVAGIRSSLTSTVMGDSSFLVDGFDPRQVLKLIEQHRIEMLCAVPSMLVSLSAWRDASKADLSSMKRWIYTGAPMPRAQIEQFEAKFGLPLDVEYGMTESSGIMTTTGGREPRRKAGAAGRPQSGELVLQIQDEHGREVTRGQIGEVCAKGPSVSPGYFELAEETAQSFRNGWLHTGDLGRVDDDGELFVVGRKKDLIITGGLNVYPIEVEDVLCHLPSVAGCAVVGAPNDLLGEEVVAFVVPREGYAPTIEDLRSWCAPKLARYKQPRIILIDALPKTDVGKVDKRALRQRAFARDPGFSRTELELQVEAAPASRRREILIAHVTTLVARILRRDPDSIDPREPLMAQGVDSLAAVEISSGLEISCGHALPSTLTFDYPTVEEIAQHLSREVFGAERRFGRPFARSAPSEPIAIVGMACRFPCGIDSPEQLWRFLQDGMDATSDIPSGRWDVDRYFDPNGSVGTSCTRRGAFVREIDRFDARFFGISPPEAENMDPQQRMLLETSWEALERASIAPDRLAGSKTGIFVGVSWGHYMERNTGYGGGTGHHLSVMAGRLSYTLDLKGPCLAIDTACSSSLVAIHEACQSLRSRESDLAIAGGVNAILIPRGFIEMSGVNALAPNGRCKTFDESADGFARAEGCGMVALRRLSDALSRRENVIAIIRATGINHDGRSSSLAAPSGTAQEALVREVVENAGVDPLDIAFVETHGTGTRLGDPVEVGALGRALFSAMPGRPRFQLGALKTNLAHLEPAAGVAALIKTTLALSHREIPPNLHLKRVNSHIALEQLGAAIPTERIPWRPSLNGRRVAGVSAFGLSGTNAHAILEEAPASEPAGRSCERPTQLLCLSAKSEEALHTKVSHQERYLREHPSSELGDICFTVNHGRSHFDHRVAILADDLPALGEALRAILSGDPGPSVFKGRLQPSKRPRIAFLFTGQGSQSAGMGEQLYRTQPTFRRTMDRCAEMLRPHLDRPLLEVLFPSQGAPSPIHQTGYAQPGLFALEYSLAELWRSWGIEPEAVIGHSLGEYVAACVAGVFDLETGIKLSALRGKLMQELPAGGAMANVFTDPANVTSAIAGYEGRVSIAGLNGPANVVISGVGADIETILSAFEVAGTMVTRLTVSHAFHSPLMDPMLSRFREELGQIAFRPPRIPLVSNLSGRTFAAGEIPDAEYWYRHVRQPVQFEKGMRALLALGCDAFVELGPHPVLLGLARALTDSEPLWLPSLKRGRADWRQLLESVAALYTSGASLDWEGFERDYPRKKLVLPTYPFERRRYWLEPPKFQEMERVSLHPVLGRRTVSPLGTFHFEIELSGATLGDLRDHRVHGSVVLPATFHLAMAGAAANEVMAGARFALERVLFERALVLENEKTSTIQLVLIPDEQRKWRFELHGRRAADAEGWTLHSRGEIHRVEQTLELPRLEEARRRIGDEVSVEEHYAQMAKQGLDYGPAFRGLARLWRSSEGAGEALGHISLGNGQSGGSPGTLDPALLDSCLQVMDSARRARSALEGSESYLPVGVERMRIYGDLTGGAWSHVALEPTKSREIVKGNLRVFDDRGALVAALDGVQLQRVAAGALAAGPIQVKDWLYEIVWERKAPDKPGVPAPPGCWLILSDTRGAGRRLQRQLNAIGDRCIEVEPGESREEDFDRLLREAQAREPEGLKGILHLRALDSHSLTGTCAELLEADAKLVCGSTLNLVRALSKTSWKNPPRLYLVTRGAQAVTPADRVAVPASMLWGLGRVISLELPEYRCRRIDLPGETDPENDHDLRGLLAELSSEEGEAETALRHDGAFVARVARLDPEPTTTVKLTKPESESYVLEKGTAGVLEELRLAPASRQPPRAGEVEVEVYAAGLNFRDVMNALGTYPGDAGPLGGECAGKVVSVGSEVNDLCAGDDVVVGLVRGGFRRFALAEASYVAKKPSHLSFEEVTTLPVAFLTAEFGLVNLAKLKQGERVLVHAGAGGVGQAAIQIALELGAQVYASAGTPEKRAWVKAMGVAHVLDSRSVRFAEDLLAQTAGAKMDVILNSLAGDFAKASLTVLVPGGRFVEIGKMDILQEGSVPKGVNYFHFDLGDECRRAPGLWQAMFKTTLAKIESGTRRCLPIRAFPIEESASAFRHMAQAKHIGKVVLSLRTQETGPLRADGTYLITGGLGGLGLCVAEWMIERGAGHVVLMGRRISESAQQKIRSFDPDGSRVTTVQGDVAQREELRSALRTIRQGLPPLRGLVHAAGCLEDGVLVRQTWPTFARVLEPKVLGAWHLHEETALLSLDFFVMFSSITSVWGNAGQGNYAAANAFLDGLAHHRRSMGMPGTSINWGPWSEVGMAARDKGRREDPRAARGLIGLQPAEGIAALEALLARDRTHATVAIVDWARFLDRVEQPGSRLFARMHKPASPGVSDKAPASEKNALETQLYSVPIAERRDVLLSYLENQIKNTLGLEKTEAIHSAEPLKKLGLDSLMAVELRNRLAKALGKPLSATLLFEYPTLDALTAHLLSQFVGPVKESEKENKTKDRMKAVEKENEAAVTPDPREGLSKKVTELLAAIENLSDEEQRQLASKLMGEEP